jgi:hypothetical protein
MHGLECRGQPSFAASARVPVTDWKRQVQKAMRELDPARLTACVHDAEWAIYQRWQELGARSSIEERGAMAAAVDVLLSITIHKLGWPDFRSNS